jgi:hypothetical protein
MTPFVAPKAVHELSERLLGRPVKAQVGRTRQLYRTKNSAAPRALMHG